MIAVHWTFQHSLQIRLQLLLLIQINTLKQIIINTTRKHKQSYRHADRPTTATAAGSSAVYRYMEYWPWALATVRRDGFRKRVTLTFDLLTSGSMPAERLL